MPLIVTGGQATTSVELTVIVMAPGVGEPVGAENSGLGKREWRELMAALGRDDDRAEGGGQP